MDIPSATRQAVMARSRGFCEQCGDKLPLELHHLTYRLEEVTGYPKDVGCSIRGYETPDVLKALCRECHLGNHIDPAGDFWADPEEMAVYWQGYWNEREKS